MSALVSGSWLELGFLKELKKSLNVLQHTTDFFNC
jgi:hypothetical protein